MLEITRATSDDLKCVFELYQLYREFYKCTNEPQRAMDFISERLQNNDAIIFLARKKTENGATAVGFAQLFPLFCTLTMERLWLLNDLFVDSRFRGLRVGENLVKHSLELAKSTNAKGVFLETETTNHNAKKLYERIGFEPAKNVFFTFNFNMNLGN